MNSKHFYTTLLLLLVIASFFHVQAAVLAITVVIIIMPLYRHFVAFKMARLFVILLLPVAFGLISGYQNSNYLILKDIYYFALPVIFIACGIILACRIQIDVFLKVLIIAGSITSLMVTAISVYFVGISSLTDPYSAHYALGIVGTPGPPIALACLLLSKKFNIKLFTGLWFNVYVAANVFGIYMFASRTYLIITLCFMLMLVLDKIKRVWVLPGVLFLTLIVFLVPFNGFSINSSDTFLTKISGSFSEVTIGNYRTEQDINLRYRGYESFMALQGYLNGTRTELLFGGLGKLIDLKTFIRLGKDTEFQYIPVLHNGWLYILVKTGAIGVLVYLTVFFGLIGIVWKKYANAESKPAIRFFSAIIIGCILSLLFTNYVVSAFFNVEMSILMITIGYSYLNYYSLLFKAKEQQKAMVAF